MCVCIFNKKLISNRFSYRRVLTHSKSQYSRRKARYIRINICILIYIYIYLLSTPIYIYSYTYIYKYLSMITTVQ